MTNIQKIELGNIADKLLNDAIKQRDKWLFKPNYIDTVLLFKRAAEMYKICEEYERSLSAYNYAADLCIKNKNFIEASKIYENAANVIKNNSIDTMYNLLHKSQKILTQNGFLTDAMKINKKLAGKYEEDGYFVNAISFYNLVMEYYEKENNIDEAHKIMAKLLQLYKQIGNETEANKIIEKSIKL
jgi:tetratricopeptide (TPR) repeat protein